MAEPLCEFLQIFIFANGPKIKGTRQIFTTHSLFILLKIRPNSSYDYLL